MRSLLTCLVFLPLPALADTITLRTEATAATVYREGAIVTHGTAISLPAGTHELVLPDLPQIDLDALRISAPGLRLGAIRYRGDRVPPRTPVNESAVTAAEQLIEDIEAQVRAVKDTADRQRITIEAEKARIAFLTGLAQSDTLPTDSAALRDISQMISAETRAAREAAFDADLAIRKTLEALEELEDNLKDARAALAALVPEEENRPLVVVNVSAEQDVSDVPLSLSYYANARWQPTYDLRLTDGDAPTLVIERGAQVRQDSGENWDGITLSVSTRSLAEQTDPGTLTPWLRRIHDPEYRKTTGAVSLQSRRLNADTAELAMEAPVILEEAATPQFAGLSVRYDFASAVNVATSTDAVRLPFDTLELEAELIARAVPLYHDSAFLVARVTNTSGEPLLETSGSLRFFDGVLVGASYLSAIEAGAEAEIGFGAIEGLQLTRRILNRNEGDRGLINRSNEQTEEVEITLSNLTDRTWNVELRDRVPYSEQEDLEITYNASPRPDIDAVGDKRGVLQWNIEMPPGNEGTVRTSHRITWPEDQYLR